MNNSVTVQTDLELIDEYIENSRQFVPPILFREIQKRGLYNIINFLPGDVLEAKAVARGRLAKTGKYFGDEEIDQIAGWITRAESLKKKLATMNMADPHTTLPVIDELKQISELILNYYKPVNFQK